MKDKLTVDEELISMIVAEVLRRQEGISVSDGQKEEEIAVAVKRPNYQRDKQSRKQVIKQTEETAAKNCKASAACLVPVQEVHDAVTRMVLKNSFASLD